MKKLLLFAALGLGSLTASAQFNTDVALTAIKQPTGVVFIDGNGDGSPQTSIELSLLNNDANSTTFSASSSYAFGVTLDGDVVQDPNGANWTVGGGIAFAPAATIDLTITTSWAPQVMPGQHELCVSLNQIIDGGFYTNNDADKEICQTFDFEFATSVNSLAHTEISTIFQTGKTLQVFVKSNESNSLVELVSITGQTVKSIPATSNGQNFYSNINVSDVSTGVYMVSVISESGKRSTQKIIIQ